MGNCKNIMGTMIMDLIFWIYFFGFLQWVLILFGIVTVVIDHYAELALELFLITVRSCVIDFCLV